MPWQARSGPTPNPTKADMTKTRDLLHFADLEQWLNERRVTEIECLGPT